MKTAVQLAQSCIHCTRCTKHCGFLDKYKMDLSGFARRPELAYSCFLCQACFHVCPKGIDGREIALAHRRDWVAGRQGRAPGGYAGMLLEKRRYLFRSYPRKRAESILFPGCNFPSFFPETTRRLMELLCRDGGMGAAFDCCGKPVAELGLEQDEARISAGIERRLEKLGAKELVTLCPNCCSFLKGRLSIPVVSVYEKLRELQLGAPVPGAALPVFLPCPDRGERQWLAHLRPFAAGELVPVQGVQCCGLGGCASRREPELAQGFRSRLQALAPSGLYTYCASCAGVLHRSGCGEVRHMLAEILQTGERPASASLLHRAAFRFAPKRP